MGQNQVAEKANDWTAIRQLLVDLDLQGRVVSLDALACQTDIVQTIAKGNGWYLLAVKDNRSALYSCSVTSPTWTAPVVWPTTGARPWNGSTDGASDAPAPS